MRVEALLRESARNAPDATAIVAGETRMSYAALDEASDRLAAAMAVGGVERGDRVVIFTENLWETAAAIFAGFKAGAVVCPVNPSAKAAGLAVVLRDCRPRAIVVHAKHMGMCLEAEGTDAAVPLHIVLQGEAAAGSIGFEECLRTPSEAPSPGGGDEDLAMLIYTSGSTGRPKGVMMSHRNVDAASGAIAAYLENDSSDVVMSALPLSFTYGFYQLMVSVRVGATLILEKGFAFPHAALERARNEGVTGLPLIPTMAAVILAMKDLQPGFLPCLRYITNAAAALPPAHVGGLRRLFPQARLYSMYGLTECARATYLPPEEIDRRPGSIGRALPGTEAFVVDEEGAPAAPGAVGELAIRGPHVMQGYWKAAEATRAALRPAADGKGPLLHTGDLVHQDADGFLYFVGRRDDIVKIRGEKVAPKQVEAVLHACPGVAEAVAFGVPDAMLGHVLHAIVVPSDPAISAREVIRHCARHLPDVMVPKAVLFRTELPKTANGKISRRLAREAAAAQRQEEIQ